MLLWPRPGERLIPALSAVLLASSFPPLHPLLPPFLGLAPLGIWIHGLPPDKEGRQAAVRGSLVFGTVYFALLFYWILVALIWFTALAIPAFVAAMTVLAALAGLVGWMLHRHIHIMRTPLWICLPVAWTAAEWLRAHLPSSLAFPWLGLGSSLTGFPELVGMAEIVGSRGVTFWIALVNGLVAGLILALRDGLVWRRRLAVVAAVVGLPMGWGVWRAATIQTRSVGQVAVVQPNVPEHIKLDRASVFDSTFAALDRLMPRIAPGAAALVVLPEVTLPLYLRDPGASESLDRVQSYAREVGAPILLGALGFVDQAPLNSAFIVEPQGLTAYQYDKRHLVPIVERVPFLPAAWSDRLDFFGSYAAGGDAPLALVDETAFGVLICYESTYPEAARGYRLDGADVLVNITNDAWYGREALYARTSALWQHPAHMVMRAIENRMGVARAANTGISLFVDPVGRITSATALFEEDVRVMEVRTSDVVTFYTRFGDLAGSGAAIAALLLTVASFGASRSLDPSGERV